LNYHTIYEVIEMTARGYARGHPIEYDWTLKAWVYSNDKTPIKNNERPCTRCGKMPTKEGYDACLGHIENATSACCGHGVECGYIVFLDGSEKRGE